MWCLWKYLKFELSRAWHQNSEYWGIIKCPDLLQSADTEISFASLTSDTTVRLSVHSDTPFGLSQWIFKTSCAWQRLLPAISLDVSSLIHSGVSTICIHNPTIYCLYPRGWKVIFSWNISIYNWTTQNRTLSIYRDIDIDKSRCRVSDSFTRLSTQFPVGSLRYLGWQFRESNWFDRCDFAPFSIGIYRIHSTQSYKQVLIGF